ncbi:TetR/AcrR family transcriptional regulator [Pullulanibacillus sp. KACC 23026]|uniref:TetR/AcrR family transcriptional regulator n=1 Tax=Pullulanibacillus sp. KACC 23026 TaxID=3028315 RepID=UPI0023B160AB|nr:TetR/AcrR family transcriptional regulator [Pullulanibacillus sp. KACC 23026]WEG14727.1 TetR/AcrR family transcriptional regulator [Pullulanibacillus sp. KACC 23026]
MKDSENLFNRSERRDAAQNRQRILDTALKLFNEYGVENVSMNQIANVAQIGPGTLYRRYRNKGELCLDLIKDNVVLLFEDLDAFLEENQNLPPEDRLKSILQYYIKFRESKAQLLKGVEDFERSNRTQSNGQSPLYNELHQILVSVFDEMKDSELNSPNSAFRADMLLAALKSDTYLFQREVRGYAPDEILDQLWATFIGK